MQSVGLVYFFMKQYVKILRKKWLRLLLLFVFPFILLGLIAVIMVGILVPSPNNPIVIGLIDEDETVETELFRMLMMDGEVLEDSFIKMESVTLREAERAIEANEMSLYFTFPKGFTESMYEGESMRIPLVGNPSRQTDSLIVRELLESLTRYLATSQASILTINDYAKELEIDYEERNDMLYKHFVESVFLVLARTDMLTEEVLVNVSTESPINYYILAIWFIALSIWLLGIYVLLEQEDHEMMQVRLRMFGVGFWHQLLARVLVTWGMNMGMVILSFMLIPMLVDVTLYPLDFIRIFTYVLLYSFILLSIFSMVTIFITSNKVRLLVQAALLLLLIVLSGALLPTLYFPVYIQTALPYIFSQHSFTWLVNLVLLEKNYTDYNLLVIYFVSAASLVALSLRWKEWVRR